MTLSRHSEGFTLPEVCVALAVFLIGTTALLGGWNFFNREIADERYRLERFYGVVSSMESLITECPLCADSLLALGHATIRLDRVPGSIPLAWAVVASLDSIALEKPEGIGDNGRNFGSKLRLEQNTFQNYDVFDAQGVRLGRLSAYGINDAAQLLRASSTVKNSGIYFLRNRTTGKMKSVGVVR